MKDQPDSPNHSAVNLLPEEAGTRTLKSGSRMQLTHRTSVLLAFGLAFVLSAGYTLSRLETGWLPQDDGTLAQSALRVLEGQLPHRDFVENYTGGLSYIHAAAFRVFGTDLASMRICLFIFFLAWLLAVFFSASRFASTTAAAAVTVLAAVWSIPQYPTPMPSWYNLFFATFGAAALLHYLEAGKRRWLFVAGVCGGISFLVKVIGLYYIAAVLLFLVFLEQNQSRSRNQQHDRQAAWYCIFSSASLLLFLSALVFLMRSRLGVPEFTDFLLPAGVLVAVLMGRESRGVRGGNAERFSALFRMILPFLAGVLAPIALFLVPYARSGALKAFWNGVFPSELAAAQAMGGVMGGVLHPPGPILVGPMLLLLLVLAAAVFWKPAAKPYIGLAVAAALAVLLLLGQADVSQMIWNSVLLLPTAVVILGAVPLLKTSQDSQRSDALRQEQLMLMLALAAVCGLVRFPFPAPIYFCYFAPLVALALVALISTVKRVASPLILGSILVFYVAFAAIRLAPAEIYAHWALVSSGNLQVFGLPVQPERRLHLPRGGGLKIPIPEAYEAVTQLVRQHARNGLLLATPESPVLYFLSGMHGPGRNDSGLSSAAIISTIQMPGLNVVVINTGSTFSASTLTREVQQAIESRFPHLAVVGRYWVYWRD